MKALAFFAVVATLAEQQHGGRGSGTSRIASPAVVASWSSYQSSVDGATTTLLVLWRGTPGWFASDGRGGRSAGGSSGGGGGSDGYEYQTFSEGGRTFTIEYDRRRQIAKLLNQEVSMKDYNVVLVDFVDSPGGPAIVDFRWIDPAPAPEANPRIDPIAAIIRRSPELFDYLRCDVTLDDPMMKAMMPIICGQMRPPQ